MNTTMILMGVGAMAVLLLGVGLVVSLGGQRRVLKERLEQVTAGGPFVVGAAQAEPSRRASPLGERLNRMLEGQSFGDRIARDLARADIKLNVGEYVSLIVISCIGFVVVGALIGRSLGFGALAGVAGLFAPRVYVGMQKSKRVKNFDNQLGDMLNLTVNGLRAGYSVIQALESVSREMPPPISTEFKRVVQEMQLGLAMEMALANLMRRINSLDLDLVITAINVQREVGGNLAEILDTISYTIRERVRIKGEIAVLTAQQMYTGYVIALLPVGLGIFLYIVNRSYMSEFFINGILGYIMLGVAAFMVVVGFLIIKKIVAIEV